MKSQRKKNFNIYQILTKGNILSTRIQQYPYMYKHDFTNLLSSVNFKYKPYQTKDGLILSLAKLALRLYSSVCAGDITKTFDKLS